MAAGPASVVGAEQGQCYRFGDALLRLQCGEREFRDRFALLFGGCAVSDAAVDLPLVDGSVDVQSGEARITLSGADVPDPEALVLAVFSEDGLEEVSRRDGWRELATRGAGSWRMDVRGNEVATRAGAPWQYVAGSILVHWAMAVQETVSFVHAAAVELAGAAVLFVGPRGSGKTTLAVGLAARGHRFLSDEVGAIRLDGPSVLSFPRAAGVRPGPRSRPSAALVNRPGLLVERFADGTSKTLVPADHLPAMRPGDALPLGQVVVLEGRAVTPTLSDLDARPENVRHLAPVRSMPCSVGSGAKTLGLLRTACSVRWHRLTAGSPDDTITLIEEHLAAT